MTNVIIRDPNTAFCLEASKAGFKKIENIDMTRAPAGCVVLPANSFGIMGAGAALALSKRFPGVEENLRDTIKHQGGELLVGQALICATEDEDIPFMIAAPTMRVPQTITDLVDVYLAARGAMREWLFICSNIEEIAEEPIVFCGMGTGKGGVDLATAARAMYLGVTDAMNGIEMPKDKEQMFKQSDDLYRKIRHGG